MAEQDNQQPQVALNQTPPPPITVNGGAVPLGSPAPTFSQTVDGKTIVSQELHRQGDVVISSERIPQGNQFADVVVIQTGAGDDNVQVSQRRNGVLDVQINGQPYEITLGAGQQLAVRTGDGNDIIHAADNVRVNMDVRGGDGNDTITTGQGRDRVDGGLGDDTIRTRGGRDDVFGGEGNDTIDAGDGNDVVYGGNGNDTIQGGRGKDYLEGGRGNDTIDGGRGNDVISGGQGDDTLRGARGRDTVYTGAGADTVDNQSGRDRVYGQTGEDTITAARGARNDVVDVGMTAQVGTSIVVQGSDEFRQRVEADLDMLRSSPAGRQMLAELDRIADPTNGNGNRVTITELQNITNGTATPVTPNVFMQQQADGTVVAGAGENATVAYNPSFHSDSFSSPAVVLFHELSHAKDIVNGSIQNGFYSGPGPDNGNVPNAERQAVGRPNTGLPFDFDGNPATAPTRDNPAAFTENGLRAEMGLPSRQNYTVPQSALTAPGTLSAGGAIPHDHHLESMIRALETGGDSALRDQTRLSRQQDPAMLDLAREGATQADMKQREQVLLQQEQQAPPQIELTTVPGAAIRR